VEPKAKSLHYLIQNLASSQEALENFKKDPLPALTILATRESHSLHSDSFIHRTIVILLGAVVLGVTAIVCWKYFQLPVDSGKEISVPSFLVALGSTALGALAGLLSPRPITERRDDA